MYYATCSLAVLSRSSFFWEARSSCLAILDRCLDCSSSLIYDLPLCAFYHSSDKKQRTSLKMFRKPSSQLHLPLLALLFLSLIISIATLACAATTLRLFDSQQGTNPWLLPIWRNHFDLRGLKLVVGTSAAVALFDAVGVVVLVVLAAQVSLRLFRKRTAQQQGSPF